LAVYKKHTNNTNPQQHTQWRECSRSDQRCYAHVAISLVKIKQNISLLSHTSTSAMAKWGWQLTDWAVQISPFPYLRAVSTG
jgi:hypothetical protein